MKLNYSNLKLFRKFTYSGSITQVYRQYSAENSNATEYLHFDCDEVSPRRLCKYNMRHNVHAYLAL